jgi:hypothetical protein
MIFCLDAQMLAQTETPPPFSNVALAVRCHGMRMVVLGIMLA